MKPVRWSSHALKNLSDREIDREEAEKTLAAPDRIVPGVPPLVILMRSYFDTLLQQKMLLRIVLEETEFERVVVTIYKTSRAEKYERSGP